MDRALREEEKISNDMSAYPSDNGAPKWTLILFWFSLAPIDSPIPLFHHLPFTIYRRPRYLESTEESFAPHLMHEPWRDLNRVGLGQDPNESDRGER